MKKIPVMFDMTFDDKGNRIIENRISDRAHDIFARATNVVPTIKRDGTAVMVDDEGRIFTRRAVKQGKVAPEGFILADHDDVTDISFGWEPWEGSSFRKIIKAFLADFDGELEAGTFELVSPKINGNPERVDHTVLFPHGSEVAEGFPSIEDIMAHDHDPIGFFKPIFADFKERGIEGIVFWVDGIPAVKLRCKDFFPEMDSRFKK